MSLEITSFNDAHYEDAARLVCARYKIFRNNLPILPPQYENSESILSKLAENSDPLVGVAALQDGHLVGFLSGLVVPSFMGKRTAFSPDWANAAQLENSRWIYEEMYAALSGRWLADGCTQHVVSVLSNDQAGLDAWKWFGFGMITVDAVLATQSLDLPNIGMNIRPADAGDADTLFKLARKLQDHITSAPVFFIHDLGYFQDWLEEPGRAAWLAFAPTRESPNQAIGFIALEPGDDCECAFLSDHKTVNIAAAFTFLEERGKGVASALLAHSLNWARDAGYTRCAVDFESTNIQAARFWMRWFEPVSFSLMRSIDDRLLRNYRRSDD